MAGIYVHIPFCRKACFYCDFHFSVSLSHKDAMLAALLRDIELQKDFFPGGTKIETIYFGGGTPSVLLAGEVEKFLQTIRRNFIVSDDPEVTLEANPDDLSRAYMQELKHIGVNRLSIGIQSLNEEVLKWMNRSHNVDQAVQCVLDARNIGFRNLNVDLIYGIPGLEEKEWGAHMQEILRWPINHLSAYSLTLEEKTPYKRLVEQGKYREPDEELALRQFEMLKQQANEGGWEHYEISNFARDGQFSRHNSAYWKGVPYLGIGPSAHSYDLKNRYWNVASNAGYMEALALDQIPAEVEELSLENRMNERILTGLRTKWGVDMDQFKRDFGLDLYEQRIQELSFYEANGHLRIKGDLIILNSKGMNIADQISAELFF